MIGNRMCKVEVAALSDLGRVRANNEDFFGFDEMRQVYVVCDGMGGMASGEVASQMAVATVLDVVKASDPATPIEMTLHRAIAAANDAVHTAGLVPEHKGMGTTLVVACVDLKSEEAAAKLILGNVGDSRAYIIQNRRAMQVTVDHSYLNELIRTGVVAVENAAKVDLKGMESIITRAIGVSPEIDPDFFAVDLSPGDIVLLASDGLTRYLQPAEIAHLVAAGDLDHSAQDLIALARARGGADNITAMLLHLVPVSAPVD